jgi:hypothetical protein
MANEIYFPFLNPLSMYDVNEPDNPAYGSKNMLDHPFVNTVYDWQEPTNYAQKWQQSDTLKIQVQSTFDPLQVDLLGKYGEVVTSLVGNLKLPNKYIIGAFAYEFTLSFAAIPEGVYYLRMSNGNLNELHLISEPICVKAIHPNTVYIQYRHSRYHGDVIFETGITFNFRVEASFDFLKPGANVTSYQDQKANPYILSATPYRVWPLVVGGNRGIPDWVVDKINIIWACNEVRVDGRLFARNESGNISFNQVEYYPMRAAIIELREGINRGSKIFSPNVDTTKKLLVVGNMETNLFGDLSANSSSNLVPVLTTY